MFCYTFVSNWTVSVDYSLILAGIELRWGKKEERQEKVCLWLYRGLQGDSHHENKVLGDSQWKLSAEDGYGQAVTSSVYTGWPAEVCPWCQSATHTTSRCWQKPGEGPLGLASGQGAQCPPFCSTATACGGCLCFGDFLRPQGFQFSELTLGWRVHRSLQTRKFCPCDLGLSECPGGALAVQPSMCWKHARSGWTATSWRLHCMPSHSTQCGAKWSCSAGMGSSPSTRAKSTCFVLLALSWHPAERTMSAFWCSVSNKLT